MIIRPRHYHFETVAVFDYPASLIWAKVMDPIHWPTWWKGVKEVELIKAGDQNGLGIEVKLSWQSILPYKIKFTSVTTKVVPCERIELVAHGDLDGTGTWIFFETDGSTTLTYVWNVSTQKTWMNLLAPIASPFFKFAHDHLMYQGENGLKQLLAKENSPHKP